jgi:hypothetical protein
MSERDNILARIREALTLSAPLPGSHASPIGTAGILPASQGSAGASPYQRDVGSPNYIFGLIQSDSAGFSRIWSDLVSDILTLWKRLEPVRRPPRSASP